MATAGQGVPVRDVSVKPRFLITIDTEGDDIWGRRRPVETRNAAFLPRFQALCDKHGLPPTYLTNYEMASSPVFREFALDVVARAAGEIGMHLHAWNSPPAHALTDDDERYHPYLVEYPVEVMRAKIARLTELLETIFNIEMVSHRAGRWSFDATYAGLLVEQGYRVDCSVTPHVSWRWTAGDPRGRGGADYSRFPDHAYFVDLHDVSRAGTSALLEVPMTTVRTAARTRTTLARVLPRRASATKALNRLFPVRWLRPSGRNLRELLDIVDRAVTDGRTYVEFMLHSSELMPGGSPTFRTDRSIEVLYEHLDRLFEHAAGRFEGATLAQFYEGFRDGGHR